MALPTNRQAGDVISASDINAIATQVNSNQTAIGGKLSVSGGTMSGGLNMGGNIISNFRSSQSADPATRSYVSTQVSGRLATTGGTMSGAINMGGYKITSLATPTNNSDAVTKSYVDNAIPTIANLTFVKRWSSTVTGLNNNFWTNNTGSDVIVHGSIRTGAGAVDGIYIVVGDITENGYCEAMATAPDNTGRDYAQSFCVVVKGGETMTVNCFTQDGSPQSGLLNAVAYKVTIS